MRAALLLLLVACAGAGRSYPCDSDAGACGDGGHGANGLVAEPVLLWRGGGHAAQTDLIRFGGAWYAIFRDAAAWSVDTAARLVVLRSTDASVWTTAATLQLPGRDLREPKLAVWNGALLVLATAWEGGDPGLHRTTVQLASSTDGAAFTPFAEVQGGQGGEAGRPRALGDALFLALWNADELFPPLAATHFGLLASRDGAGWAQANAPALGPGAHQGELLLRANGERLLLAPERAVLGSPERASVCRAAPGAAWTCWTAPGAPPQSPALLELGDTLFVAGGRDTGGGHLRVSLWQLALADQSLTVVADVPQSFGEAGGPALQPLDGHRALLTFHSTSALDPRLAALGHEPTVVEAEAQGLSTDALSVVLDLSQAPAGR